MDRTRVMVCKCGMGGSICLKVVFTHYILTFSLPILFCI